VTSGWHKLARVFRMEGEEVSARLGQELRKRGDLLRHKVGIGPPTVRMLHPLAEGKFFFERRQAAELAQLLQETLPEQAAEIVREADEICQHHFRLLGYENLDYGAAIDWHLDPVHNKRAPLDPWFKIPFLEFDTVGDHKVIWELNRHQHLVTLAKAWLLTRNEKYVGELIAQWHGWMKANPYPLGINWSSTLEVAFRSLSWTWVDHLISDAPRYAELRSELLSALAFHGRYIERYLSTYFSPNTHLLGEAVAMFFLGTLYPQTPSASRWKKQGWEIVLHEAGRQVRPDGLYFEQSLYYHAYALDFFLYARQLAAVNDLPILAAYDGVLLTMLDVVEALAQAGPAEGFGDDDGGRLFDPHRNHTEHLTDPLALGALAYNRDDLPAAQLTEESIWLFGERAVAELRDPAPRQAVNSVAFPDGGVYVLADSEPFPQNMMIDAGPQGVGSCGHGHADALSVHLTMNGKRWLIDSGSGIYVSSDPQERNHFRGTAAHNTIRVDEQDQAIPDQPFSWTNIPTTCAESWVVGKTFTYFCGSHDGYSRLADPVTHRRTVLRVNACDDVGLWLVRDVILGGAEHDLQQHWHFASEISLERAGPSEFVVSRPEADQSLIRITFPDQTFWKADVTQELVSPAYGRCQPAPVLRCHGRVKLPAECATILMAESPAAQRRCEVLLTSTETPAAQIYELHDQIASHQFFFASGKQGWTLGPWSSDCALLYCRTDGEKLIQIIAIGGSRVSWHDQPMFDTRGPFQFFEWRKRDGIKNAGPGPLATTRQFDEMVQASYTPSPMSGIPSSYAEKH
jgi:Heparinase II/III-like protein/Heparinase II/III N-terminus